MRLQNDAAPKTAYITVTNRDGESAQVTVTVSPRGGWYVVDEEYIESYCNEVFNLVNFERKNAGLSAVEYAEYNQRIATAVCVLMAENGYYHQDFSTIANQYPEAHDYGNENIMRHKFSDYRNNATMTSPEQLARLVVTAWMNSPGHRDTLMNRYGKHMVVGLFVSDNGYAYTSLGLSIV